MRRSFISATTVNQIMASHRRIEKDRQDRYLIEVSQTATKELPPQYELLNIKFDPDTRMSKVQFVEIKKYRTIERYITKDYVKYPIYSDWKEKTKMISRSIKLTNEELESLDTNADVLVRQFARYIVVNLNDEDLYPSWFILEMLENEYDRVCSKAQNEFDGFRREKQKHIKDVEHRKNNVFAKLENDRLRVNELLKQKNEIQERLDSIKNAPQSAWRSVFSLGIYNYYKSNKRQKKIESMMQSLETEIQVSISNIDLSLNEVRSYEGKIADFQSEIKQKQIELNAFLKKEKNDYNQKIQQIKPLQDSVCVDNESFMLLKMLSGLTYEKIIGCYIIRNREKDKYYVGQSKDVLRRLKQHFKGTIPNNVVFAEDYYTSSFDNKENLFEVKIIPCDTKDELDRMEKELIEKYNAFGSGYNGTSGNN